MFFGPMWKGVINPSKKSLTRLKLVRPILQEPSTKNMMSAAASVLHSKGFLGKAPKKKKTTPQNLTWRNTFFPGGSCQDVNMPYYWVNDILLCSMTPLFISTALKGNGERTEHAPAWRVNEHPFKCVFPWTPRWVTTCALWPNNMAIHYLFLFNKHCHHVNTHSVFKPI